MNVKRNYANADEYSGRSVAWCTENSLDTPKILFGPPVGNSLAAVKRKMAIAALSRGDASALHTLVRPARCQ
jgi:hypothetical protein